MTEAASAATPTGPADVTAALAAKAAGLRYQHLSPEARTVAKQCVLDFLGVSISGMDEPLTGILSEVAGEDGGSARSTVIGRGEHVGIATAALINGAMGHALDYDDVHLGMGGHPTVPVAPAVLALAEARGLSGRDVVTAFVAGLETECRIGRLVGPSHYAAGWHNTGTIGAFGAAAACANLLGLDAERTRHALGIAGTQAAGLKSVFGTMCKPLHAGKAAQNGVQAARWAAKGFTSHPSILDVPQGFLATQSTTPRPAEALAEPEGGFHIPATLFKYHAACYLTHSSIEAVRTLKERFKLTGEEVERVTLRIDEGHLKVCGIPEPRTGLEIKFSLRFTAAMALAGRDTANDSVYTDELANDPALAALRDKVAIETRRHDRHSAAEVVMRLRDGREVSETTDVGEPMADLDAQWHKLAAKFRALVAPVLGAERTERLVAACRDLDSVEDLGAFMAMTTRH
ncbi:MAG: MmgE/PrpD family protein [Rhodospirillales bacterium]|nr:MAG: MmgE/PrpD family protein [Rhodospirillales bacterium]